jgi:hypothetical protein
MGSRFRGNDVLIERAEAYRRKKTGHAAGLLLG